MTEASLKLILKTRHFKCLTKATVEIHTLTCHRHIFMYLLAIKSLLRFNDHISVVVHDDGSLTKEDESLLKEHIEGILIIKRSLADRQIDEILKNYPVLREYRKNLLILIQALDYVLLSRSEKIISLDSDTIFLKKPERLIKWAFNDNKEMLHLYDQRPHGQKRMLSRLGLSYPPHFCAGLFFYYKVIIDLPRIEYLLTRIKRADWFISQNILSILVHQPGGYKVGPLDTKDYQDGNSIREGAVFRHYWSSVMGTGWYNPRSAWHKFNNSRVYGRDCKQVLRELT